jgi:hypothetical protein
LLYYSPTPIRHSRQGHVQTRLGAKNTYLSSELLQPEQHNMFNAKDTASLIKKPNTLLADYHARIMLEEMPEHILTFYEQNADKINGSVIVVRSKEDEPKAAYARNTGDKVLFVFGDQYWMTSYFSGVCKKFDMSAALIKRTSKASF